MKQLIASLLLLCSACVQLGSDPQPMRYYLLQPNAAAQPVTTPQAVTISLQPIRMPAYLDRPQLTSRNQHRQVIIAPLDRWAEPLQDNFSRVLAENLSRHLVNATVSSERWPTASDAAHSVTMTINSFDGILGEQSRVDIRWQISSADASKPAQHGHFTQTTPIGNSYMELVTALNNALDQFARQLAQSVSKNQ